ncbi:MAG: alpha/beta hydrolase [Comamonas sp.]|nr:alpha/beta hydrolase [Comamonas sp.]
MHHWPAAAPVSASAPASATAQAQQGTKAPVLLLHGGSGSWTHWVANLADLTAAGHAVWAVDMPGFGGSDPVPGQQDVDDTLPLLAQMLEQCFAAQAVQLMGFSLGGFTAGLLAAAYPHLVRQLVLVGAPGLGLRDKPIYRLQGWRHLPDPQAQLLRHCHNLGALMFADKRRIDRDTLALHVANVRCDRLPRRRLAATDALRQALGHITCPVHAIYGEQDVIYSGLWLQVQACLQGHARQFQRLHLLPGVGHWAQYEQPTAFAQAVLPLLL